MVLLLLLYQQTLIEFLEGFCDGTQIGLAMLSELPPQMPRFWKQTFQKVLRLGRSADLCSLFLKLLSGHPSWLGCESLGLWESQAHFEAAGFNIRKLM